MKTFKLIIKGILVWLTAIVAIILVSGVDSILESYGILTLMLSLFTVAVLVFVCITFITAEEFKIVSGYDIFNKILNIKDEDGE